MYFGMKSGEGEMVLDKLVQQVKEMSGPDGRLKHEAGEALRLGCSVIHLEHKEIENVGVRQRIFEETGRRYGCHLGIS